MQSSILENPPKISANVEFIDDNINQQEEEYEYEHEEISNIEDNNQFKSNSERVFLWEEDMRNFWEEYNFKPHHINIFINLGHGKFSSPKLLTSYKIDINEFAEYTLEECKHLRARHLAQRYLENIQKLFPGMILNKAIYYNPYLLTLSLFTIKKRKNDLIDLISTHLSEINNPNKYNHLFFAINNNNQNNENDTVNKDNLNKSDIIELIDWDKLFENVPTLLTANFSDTIKHVKGFVKIYT